MLNKISMKKIDAVLEKKINDTPQMTNTDRAFPNAPELENITITEDPAELEEFIEKHINFQYAVATYFMSGNFGKSHVIGFIKDIPVIEQVAISRRMFEEVSIYGVREKMVGLYVKKPSGASLCAFENLYDEGRLNKWLVQLLIPEKDEITERIAYEYVKDGELSTDELHSQISDFAQDEFIIYLRSNERNRLADKKIRIGGTFNDIKNSNFVKFFAELVDSVYLYTAENGSEPSGKTKYAKYITWAEAGQKKKAYFPIGLLLFIVAFGTGYLKSLWYVLGLAVFALIVARVDLKCIAIKKEQLGEGSEAWQKFKKKKIVSYGIACGLILYTFIMQVWVLFV